MPDFLPARRGLSLSEAYAEAATYAPAGRVMLETLEFYQPLGTPTGPVRVVNDDADFTATLELDAPRDPGAEVEFMAASLGISRADESDQEGSPELTVTAGNVSGEMSAAVRRARGSLVPWELIGRMYAQDDPSGPAQVPVMKLFATGVEIDGQAISIRAGYGDPTNVSVPRQTFRRSQYPGLVR
jgi:hypothetical protein